ncbi:MAG: hypothetical protein PHV87_04945, partial [Bacilli bacterium]|nr:hypothetical protein [Bacilli bacterium]
FILELFTSKKFRNNSVWKTMVNHFENLCLNKEIVYLTSAPNSIWFFERFGYTDTGILDKC